MDLNINDYLSISLYLAVKSAKAPLCRSIILAVILKLVSIFSEKCDLCAYQVQTLSTAVCNLEYSQTYGRSC
jgi:hypothetical protein